jgi:aspartyl-tRNA(Asn)/glutamyl-tRNA(Gln) amidotransferase subunit B
MTETPVGPVIGLEIHVQLATATKLFCADPATFGDAPNTHVCPVCLGLPGALPVTNGAAVRLAVRAALGLNCTIRQTSRFARKQYFYPDLPKGYQVTQYDRPLATGGWLRTGNRGEDVVRIRRVHLEEDAGRLLHDRVPGSSAIDLNRAGIPLVEIVTEPDLRSPAQARAFLVHLKRLLEYLEISDCDMEKGSLRVDANISVRSPAAVDAAGRTEIKNLNSFANVEKALRFEMERQGRVVAAGRSVARETLLWDAGRGVARAMRSKEESHDYRYFPDPDLPPLVLDPEALAEARQALPELPGAREERFRREYGLPAYDAEVLTASRELADYFEAVAGATGDAKAASNWIMTEVLAWLNRSPLQGGSFPVPPARLAELIDLVGDGTVSARTARGVLARMVDTGRRAASIVEEEELVRVADDRRIGVWVAEVLAERPDEVARFRMGENRLLDFLMGQVMKKSGGRADPERVQALLRSSILG